MHAEECAALGGVEGGQLGGNSGGTKGGGSDGEEGGGEGEGEGNRGGGGSAGGADGSDPMFAIGTARTTTGTFANTARLSAFRTSVSSRERTFGPGPAQPATTARDKVRLMHTP